MLGGLLDGMPATSSSWDRAGLSERTGHFWGPFGGSFGQFQLQNHGKAQRKVDRSTIWVENCYHVGTSEPEQHDRASPMGIHLSESWG